MTIRYLVSTVVASLVLPLSTPVPALVAAPAAVPAGVPAGVPVPAGVRVPAAACRSGPAALEVPANAPPPPANLSARSWVVADLDRGTVLGACAPHGRGAPASVQKLLLVATVMPALDPAQVVTVVPADLDFEPGSSAVGLQLGGHYRVDTLWLGLLLNSGNDAANVLARLGGGADGAAGGVRAMNDEARRLGAVDTHAATPSGLDGPDQRTTAYDLALIARACFNRTDFRRYIAARSAQIPPQPPKDRTGYQIQNDNRLLATYPGALGGKSGFTDVARHTFVGAAQRGDRRLVVTLLGAEHEPVPSWQQAAELLDWGFAVPPESSVDTLVPPPAPPPLGPAATADPAGVDPAGSGAWLSGAAAVRTGWPWILLGVGTLAATAVLLLLGPGRRRRGTRPAGRPS